MSRNDTETSDWTDASLLKLLAAMKSSIPEDERHLSFSTGMRHMDWKTVAFPPFSPEACQQKWGEILPKIRKTRTFGELMDEAEDVIYNPVQNNPVQYVEKYQLSLEEYNRKMLEFRKRHQEPSEHSRRKRKRKSDVTLSPDNTEDAIGLPPKPAMNGYSLFCEEQKAGVSVPVMAQWWRDLTESQKDEYNTRCTELRNQYTITLNKYLMTLNAKKRQEIINKHGIKRSKEFPGEPKMPTQSGRGVFWKEQMNLLREKVPCKKERFLEIDKMWKDLSDAEKEPYKEKVQENVMKYSMELQKWFKTLTAAVQEDYLTCKPSKRKLLDGKTVAKPKVMRKKNSVLSDSKHEDIEDSGSVRDD